MFLLLNTTFFHKKDNANLLNKQFLPVISPLSPIKLGQLCIDNLHDFFSERERFQCSYMYLKMHEININLNGILKILSKVNGQQWPGTDAIRTTVPPSKPTWETTKITNRHNTKRTYGQPNGQLLPNRWSLNYLNLT